MVPSYVERSVVEIPEREADRILYVLTVEDLKELFEQDGDEWADLSDEDKGGLISYARKYIEGLMGEGLYGWSDAIEDAIEDWKKDKEEKTR